MRILPIFNQGLDDMVKQIRAELFAHNIPASQLPPDTRSEAEKGQEETYRAYANYADSPAGHHSGNGLRWK